MNETAKRLFRLLIVVYAEKVPQFHQPDILTMIDTMRFEQKKYNMRVHCVSSHRVHREGASGSSLDGIWMIHRKLSPYVDSCIAPSLVLNNRTGSDMGSQAMLLRAKPFGLDSAGSLHDPPGTTLFFFFFLSPIAAIETTSD